MRAKANDAVAALEALKKGSPVPAAAPARAPVAASVASGVASGSAADKEAIKAAQKTADMLTWAAKTCEREGMPQAAQMRAKANDAVAALEALKKGSPVPAATAPPSIAKEDCPVSPTLSGATKEEIQEAEKHAHLMSWAAETAKRKGMPQAAELQTKALAAVKKLEDLKACQEEDSPSAKVPVARAAPVAQAARAAQAPAAQAAQAKVSKAEFVAAKK